MSSEFTQVCDDLHKCRNGGQCVEHPDFPGMFTCDCATASSEVYAGFSCDHMATSYCNEDNTVDSKSFCTNNGVCRDFLDEDGFHQGCDCPDGYKGDVRCCVEMIHSAALRDKSWAFSFSFLRYNAEFLTLDLFSFFSIANSQ